MIRATCQECGHKHDFSDKHYGKSARCRGCGARIKIAPDQVLQSPPPPQQQSVTMNATTVIAPARQDNTVAAVVNALFAPFGFLIQGRVFTFLLYLIAWFIAIMLCFVVVGIPFAMLLWIAGIVDAAKYRG